MFKKLLPRPNRLFHTGLASASLLCLAGLSRAATSIWVHYDTSGNLQYLADGNGNHIMDYSWAGYHGGGVALPQVPAKATVNASGGDDTAAIQNAIDTVAALTPDSHGIRGAVLLAPGNFHVGAAINLHASGVVLSGSGSGSGGTVITMTGSAFRLFSIAGSGSYTRSNTVSMTDTYVPSGATSFTVSSTSGYSIGDTILISRPVTSAWVHFMGMDTLTRSGSPQTWISVGSEFLTDRVITAISGSRITIDAPLTDSFDSQYLNPPRGSVSKYTYAGRISEVGLEHLRAVAPGQELSSSFGGLSMDSVINAWVRDVVFQDTENSVDVNRTAKQVTLDNVQIVHTYAQSSSAAPADFGLSGTQVLVNQTSVTGQGNTWPFITQNQVTGPIVLLKCFADDRGFGPHQRWATGMLCDLTNFPRSFTGDKAGVAYSNRGNFGSGHGWDAGWGVAWNVNTPDLLIQAPPGAHNWCIGCIGTELSEAAPGSSTILPNGDYDSLGTPVTPGSLYLAQLKQRLGIGALNAIGYADVDGSPFVGTTATPTFSPAGGTYSTDQTVSLATATTGASIRYTVDGSTPSATAGTLYTTPIGISATTTIKAIAFKSGLSDSAVATATYTIAKPDFSLSASPISQTVTAGASTTYTVTVSAINGFGGSVTLSASGLPVGATASFSPASVTGSGTSTLTVATSSSAAAGTSSLTITGTSGALAHNAVVGLTINPATNPCVTATNNSTFTNTAITSKNGTFTATFDATPSASPINSVIGLSKGAQTAFTGFAAIARFNPSGDIDARNGSAYAAASTIPYTAKKSYHFRLVINVTAHTYSIFVTPAGGSEITVGSNFAFRTEQNTVTSLDHWGVEVDNALVGSDTVCNFAAP